MEYHEKNISAEQSQKKKNSWFSSSDEDEIRPRSDQEPSPKRKKKNRRWMKACLFGRGLGKKRIFLRFIPGDCVAECGISTLSICPVP